MKAQADDFGQMLDASLSAAEAMIARPRRTLLALVFILLASSSAVYAQAESQALNMRIDGVGTVSAPLQIVLVLTLLSFVPAALVIMTSFTRIAIVFHFLRRCCSDSIVFPDEP
ncbi:MAG: hypothetical protein QM736_27570 [Vicinamibacterales bacterium]